MAEKLERQSQPPIFSLPTEILQYVVTLHQNHFLADFNFATSDWIKITHVCQRLRSAVLDCPLMWIHFPVFHAGQTEILQRAKLVPLSLRAQLDPYETTRLAKQLRSAFAHLEQVQNLQIKIPSTLLPDFKDDLPPKASLLRSLYLDAWGDTPDQP